MSESNKKWEAEAIAEAQKSPCKKRKVGAILVYEGQIIGRGHNHLPVHIGNPQICEDDEGVTFSAVIHAEAAAIANAETLAWTPAQIADSEMFITHQPCEGCKKILLENRVVNIHVVNTFMKFDTGKLRYDLIPVEATKALAEVLTYGAKKYKPHNWKEVDDKGRYTAALMRHLEAWRGGETRDKESDLPHLAHAMTNLAFLLHFEEKQE